jgi:large subunit ribosomal protein L18e
MTRGTTNPRLRALIEELKALSIKENVNIWKRIASDLERPTRNRRAVNLSRIARFTKADENVIVPGKVLGTGELTHKVNIAAFTVSKSALTKVGNNGTFMTIEEVMQKNPKGKNLRIIG